MPNSNCLEGKKCPGCGHEDEILVYASMWVSVRDEGCDPFAESTEDCDGLDYDEHSRARCPACRHEGRLADWGTVIGVLDLTPDAVEKLARELAEETVARGLPGEELDELIHDVAADWAAGINNLGVREQIAFVLRHCGEAGETAIRRLLEAEGGNEPSTT